MSHHGEIASAAGLNVQRSRHVAHHFDSESQQMEAGRLGMWLFLASEILFFSGLFVAYAIFRSRSPAAFSAGSELLSVPLGALNTVVLLTSSLTMALAVRSAQQRQQRPLVIWLAVTLTGALLFLGVKSVEYAHKIDDGFLWKGSFGIEPGALIQGVPAEAVATFFSVYFAMTGLHALHIIGGIGAIIWLLNRAVRGDFARGSIEAVDYVGLYWHLVDLIWIYLFPLLYLI